MKQNTLMQNIAVNLFTLTCLFFVFLYVPFSALAIIHLGVGVVYIVKTILARINQKVVFALFATYAVVTAVQLSVNWLLLRYFHDGMFMVQISKIVGIVLLALPLIANKVFFLGRFDEISNRTFIDVGIIKSGKIYRNINDSNDRGNRRKQFMKLCVCAKSLIADLPRHSSVRYINRNSVDEEYFRLAKAQKDPYIYIVLSNSKSPASEIIALFTHTYINHASISFDADLKTLISYNKGGNGEMPGLNREYKEQILACTGSYLNVFRIKATPKQKAFIINRISTINREGNAYNIFGLIFKASMRKNTLFCSQFVYRMLQESGLSYFVKREGRVQPADFSNRDFSGAAKFCYSAVNGAAKRDYTSAIGLSLINDKH